MIALHPDEEVILEKHRFWLPIAIEGVTLLLVAAAPLAGFFLSEALPGQAQVLISQYKIPFLFLAAAWFLIIWTVFAVIWTNYYLDVLIITTKRVIDIEQITLFARDLAEARLENMQDVRVEVKGFLPSLLNFGNLFIQTAGEAKEFRVKNISDPHGVREIIARQHDRVLKNFAKAGG